MSRLVLHRARREESDAVAALYRRTAAREWSFLYPHNPREDRAFFRQVLAACAVWAAELDGRLVGFCAARRGWIDHLYVAQEHHGEGVGRALLARALRGRSRLRLWTFQRNARSRRFYSRNGFVEALFTDGADNEEHEPDVMLEWRRPAARRLAGQ
jgi:putative acetyltransferase